MNNLKITTRLALLIGLASILLLIVGTVGIVGTSQANESLRSVYVDRTIPTADLAAVNRQNLRTRLSIASMVLDPTPAAIESGLKQIDGNMAEVVKRWNAYLATELVPEEAKLAKETDAAYAALTKDGLIPALDALKAGDFDKAREISLTKIGKLNSPFAAGLDGLIKIQGEVAEQDYKAAVARYETMRALSIGAIVVGVLIAVFFGYMLSSAMKASLKKAIDATEAIARGDLSLPIEVSGKDEISQLLQALSAMQNSLTQVVSTVRAGSESVSTASTQIAEGNQDLSARTEAQASSLEETAASMEEMTSTVQQNASNAQTANQLAQSASTVATKGGEVVGQVVETMKGINDSSRKIADIISVIDGIAFQTNILALNAAVEAARAGEQGRGFAVVAGEVRSLAQRSAAAAKEIKDLITDSVARVEEGTTLVNQAGETMTEVVNGVRRVTDIMAEISTASSEQSAGIGQIGEAVQQMDQATQQNAALVEEMAAAANSLRGQAHDLVQAVAVFKLSAHDAGGHAPASLTPGFQERMPAPRKPAATKPAPKAMPATREAVPQRIAAAAPKNDEWDSF